MHVIITGSNAKLLSGELATHLSGRAKEIHLYPFSFAEYCNMKEVDTEKKTTKAEGFRRAAFDDYMKDGGFPELLSMEDKRTYISNLVDNILKRDIEQRYKITYKTAFAGENLGWRLETIVLIQLLRKCKQNGWDLYYLNDRSSECDFIVCDGNNVLQAIQVSYDISSDKTRKREVNGLMMANKQTKCENLLLLTDHESADIDKDGHHISIRPVYEWSITI